MGGGQPSLQENTVYTIKICDKEKARSIMEEKSIIIIMEEQKQAYIGLMNLNFSYMSWQRSKQNLTIQMCKISISTHIIL